MPLITFTASHFRQGGPRGAIAVKASSAELIWAAITVGKWRDDLFASGRYSFFEAVSRVGLHWAYLCSDARDRLARTSAYDDLDATEKSSVSYAIGMSTAKLFASRQLAVPWLMHLDRYRIAFGVSLRAGRSRPDLIGPRDPDNKLDWLVVEAKAERTISIVKPCGPCAVRSDACSPSAERSLSCTWGRPRTSRTIS